jgi:hypothetical protein
MVSQPNIKRISSKKGSQNYGGPRDIVDMEVDSTNVPDWVAL